MNKINAEVKTKEQRDELIKQLEGMTFERVLPKTWEEYLELIDYHERTILKSELSLLNTPLLIHLKNTFKLKCLIDYYNDGWTPDYTDGIDKHVIFCKFNDLRYLSVRNKHYFFTFKTPQLRNEFLNNFEEMIKKHYNIGYSIRTPFDKNNTII